MSSLKELTDLKKKVESLQRDADRASGAYGETMKRLEEEFGCDTLEEAEELLEGVQKKETKAKIRFEKGLAVFKEEWKDAL